MATSSQLAGNDRDYLPDCMQEICNPDTKGRWSTQYRQVCFWVLVPPFFSLLLQFTSCGLCSSCLDNVVR